MLAVCRISTNFNSEHPFEHPEGSFKYSKGRLHSISRLHTPSFLSIPWPVYFDITTSLNIFKPVKPGEQHLPRISKPFVYLVRRVSITWKLGLRLFFLSRRWTCGAWKATGNEPPGPSRLSLHSLARNGSRSWLKM